MHQLRAKMMEILMAEISKNSLKELFRKFLGDQIPKQITKDCSKIFPLENVLIRKVKVLKKPKFDLTKLMELYQDKPENVKADVIDESAKNALAA